MQGKRFIGDGFELDRAAYLAEFLCLIFRNRSFLIGLGGSKLVSGLLDVLVGQLIAGIDLECAQEFGERGADVALRHDLFAVFDVLGPGLEAQALIRRLIAEILGFLPESLVVVFVRGDRIVFGFGQLTLLVERFCLGARSCEAAKAQGE